MMDFYQKNVNELREEAQKLVVDLADILLKEGKAKLIQYVWAYVDEGLKKSGLFEKATCSKSCSFCCHDTIYGSEYEIEVIKSILKELKIKPDRKRSKIQNCKTADKLTWQEKACVYLSEEGNCRIYQYRPVVCRTHNNIGPVEDCNKEFQPKKSVQEGRILQVEAMQIALLLLCHELTGKELIPIHKVM